MKIMFLIILFLLGWFFGITIYNMVNPTKEQTQEDDTINWDV